MYHWEIVPTEIQEKKILTLMISYHAFQSFVMFRSLTDFLGGCYMSYVYAYNFPPNQAVPRGNQTRRTKF